MPAAPSVRRTTAALAAVLAGSPLLVTACSGSSDTGLPSSPVAAASTLRASSAAASDAGAATQAPVSADAPSATDAAATGGPVTVGSRRRFAGSRGTYSWDLTYPQFSGGPAVEANRRMQATLATAVKGWEKGIHADGEPESDDRHRLTGEATVSVNDGRTLQVRLRTYHFVTGTAHGLGATYTMVLDVTATPARPVLLRTLLLDPASGYAALAREITRQAKADGADADAEALGPNDANWGAWQAGPEGLTFSFGSYQLGAMPAVDYTVAWGDVRRLLTPAAYRLVGPAA